jgi:hypothetical protein
MDVAGSKCYLLLEPRDIALSMIVCSTGLKNPFIVWKDADQYITHMQNKGDTDKDDKIKIFLGFFMGLTLVELRSHMQ